MPHDDLAIDGRRGEATDRPTSVRTAAVEAQAIDGVLVQRILIAVLFDGGLTVQQFKLAHGAHHRRFLGRPVRCVVHFPAVENALTAGIHSEQHRAVVVALFLTN